MSKRKGRSNRSGRNTRWIGIGVAVFIVLGIVAVWAGDFRAPQDKPGVRIYLTANQAMEWVKDKPVAFLQLSFPECPSCQAASPTIEKLVAEYNLHLAYVNIRQSQNEWLARELGLQATPSIYPYQNGQLAGPPVVGNVGEAAFRSFFLRYLESNG